jgi:hypothetical protein
MPVPLTSTGPQHPVAIYGTYASGTAPGVYFVVMRHRGEPRQIGHLTVPGGHNGGTFIVTASLPAGAYTLGGSGQSDGDISVYNANFDSDRGSWTLNEADLAITGTLDSPAAFRATGAIGAFGRR